ncbi:irregular chiasm C-roughest protein-like [Limulus polyphemus]|uniref:Irregular chiasm C-roughest protein-like n=1 Tax=Limulus polyphemus TaxID=6850 RepID=A0ABM1T754_LIMPO|nr:irregular chiasm C-roughest protein-like [Limulus polyphemus]
MWTLRIFSLIVSLQYLSLAADSVQQKFIRGPEDKTVILGEDVLLPCRVENKVGMLQWTREGFGLGSDRELIGFPRYTMVGNDEEGDFSLQIINAQLDDDAEFQCQVGAAEGVKGIRSKTAMITVTVPPEPPKIVQGPFLLTTAGKSVQLTCEAHAGKPPAELSWLGGDGDVVTTNTEYETQELNDGKRANAILRWEFTPTRKHHLKNFTCRSENPALKQPALTTIRMEVKYAPEVKLTVFSESIAENDDVQLTCEVEANPADVIYKWYRNNEIIAGDHTTHLLLNRVSREYNMNNITCEASNSVGNTKSTKTLKVLYGPKIKTFTDNIAADIGGEVCLSCDADGNPNPEIAWLHEESSSIVGFGPQLVISDITPKKAGKYTCRITVPGFPEISTDVMVYIKGPPTVKAKPVQYGEMGQKVEVECSIYSVPSPARITWTKNSQVVEIDNTHGYEIVTQPLADGVRNLLIIHNAEKSDFGTYNCSVWNDFGHDSMLISLKRQEHLPTLIVIAGVIGGIFFVVSLTVLIILCLRKKSLSKGKEFGSEKQGKPSDTVSSRGSDLEVEIRTTSSLPNDNDRCWDEASDTGTQDYHKYSESSSRPPSVEIQRTNGYGPYMDYAARTPGVVSRTSYYVDETGFLSSRRQQGHSNSYIGSSHPDLLLPQRAHVSSRDRMYSPTFSSQHYITVLPSQVGFRTDALATNV